MLTPLNVARSCKLHPEGGLGAEGIKMLNRNKLMIRFDTYRFDCDTKSIIVFSPGLSPLHSADVASVLTLLNLPHPPRMWRELQLNPEGGLGQKGANCNFGPKAGVQLRGRAMWFPCSIFGPMPVQPQLGCLRGNAV